MCSQLGVFFCLVSLSSVGQIWAAPGQNFVHFNEEMRPRIINGTLAAANATSHQVSVRRRLNDGYFFGTGHICGGSLISPDVVLSAAHCFVDYQINNGSYESHEDFIVVMGNLDRFERNNNTLIYNIKNIVLGPKVFNLSTYQDDIALLFLNDSVPVDHTTVRPVLLNRMPIAEGELCQVTGWGKTEDGYLSDYLMTVDVPYISREVCANANYTQFTQGLIRDGVLCAGYLEQGEKDACGGDSGGPLICQGLQAGIVSWGSGCALPMLPGVYTDVAYYYPWIEDHVKANNGTLPGGDDGAMTASNVSLMLIAFLATFVVFVNRN